MVARWSSRAAQQQEAVGGATRVDGDREKGKSKMSLGYGVSGRRHIFALPKSTEDHRISSDGKESTGSAVGQFRPRRVSAFPAQALVVAWCAGAQRAQAGLGPNLLAGPRA